MAQHINLDEIMDDAQAYGAAQRLARSSRFDCIAWTRLRDSQQRYARLTQATIRQAMLDGGTQSRIICYGARGSEITGWNWWVANNVRRQLKRGWYTHG